jgi:histidine triad (HIT) family protein
MADCIFCKIVDGSIPSTKVEESANVYAFRDIQPQAPTHVLLIPRKHIVASAADIGFEHGAVLAEIFALASRIAQREGLDGGWRLVTNVGPDAGQSVLHLHFHLLGGRAMQWPPG